MIGAGGWGGVSPSQQNQMEEDIPPGAAKNALLIGVEPPPRTWPTDPSVPTTVSATRMRAWLDLRAGLAREFFGVVRGMYNLVTVERADGMNNPVCSKARARSEASARIWHYSWFGDIEQLVAGAGSTGDLTDWDPAKFKGMQWWAVVDRRWPRKNGAKCPDSAPAASKVASLAAWLGGSDWVAMIDDTSA